MDGWVQGIPCHQQTVLFRRDTPCFFCRAWPLEAPGLKALIKKQETILFPYEALDFSAAGSAEEEEGASTEWVKVKFLLHKGSKAVNPFPEVGFPNKNIHMPEL